MLKGREDWDDIDLSLIMAAPNRSSRCRTMLPERLDSLKEIKNFLEPLFLLMDLECVLWVGLVSPLACFIALDSN